MYAGLSMPVGCEWSDEVRPAPINAPMAVVLHAVMSEGAHLGPPIDLADDRHGRHDLHFGRLAATSDGDRGFPLLCWIQRETMIKEFGEIQRFFTLIQWYRTWL